MNLETTKAPPCVCHPGGRVLAGVSEKGFSSLEMLPPLVSGSLLHATVCSQWCFNPVTSRATGHTLEF